MDEIKSENLEILEKIKAEIVDGKIKYPLSEIDKAINGWKYSKNTFVRVVLPIGLMAFGLGFGVFVDSFFMPMLFLGIILYVVGASVNAKGIALVEDILTAYKNNSLGVSEVKTNIETVENNSSKMDELKKLASLRSDGVLTEEEFQEEKKKLLNAA